MFDGNSLWSTLGLIAVMGLLFYFLLIRPQKRRQKEQAKLMDALAPGSTVMLSSGIIVKVVEVGEAQVLVELAPGLEMTVLKQVIINTSATDEFDADDAVVGTDMADQDPISADPVVQTSDETVEPATEEPSVDVNDQNRDKE